jgi:transposase
LVNSGHSASEVARLTGDSPRAIAYWVARYKKGGMKGLEEEPRPGRPSKLNRNQIKKLQAYLIKARAGSKPVTAHILSQYIKKSFGTILTIRQCWRILKRLKA